jgi:hypothetical protein
VMSETAPCVSRVPVVSNSNQVGFLRLPLSTRVNVALRWALFLYLGFILCPIRYCAPTPDSVDNTWFFALNYTAAHHSIMGRGPCVEAGPLFYLLVPLDIGNNLARGLAFQAALWVLVIVVLWDLFFRGGFPLRNLAVFSIFIGLSTLDYHQVLYPGNLLLTAALVVLVHFRLRGGIMRYIGALAMMGLMPLFQFVGALIAVGVTAGVVIDHLAHGPARRKLDIALALTVPLGVAVLCCRLALGSFHSVAAYVRSSLEFARVYSIIMSTSGPRIELVAAFEATVVLVTALLLLMVQDRDKARFCSLLLLVPLLINVKHGFVRQDAPHIVQFFCFVALALALVTLATPLSERFANVSVALVLLSFTILWQDYLARDDPKSAIASVTGARTPTLVWSALHFNHLRHALDAAGRENYSADARVEPEIKFIVGHEPVAFLSDVYSNALMDGLNLVLLPTRQRDFASAYLDQLNATWIYKEGPPFLIFDGKAIDARHPWTESPATWAEVYRWYETRMLGAHNLLLQRRVRPRFTHFEPLAHRTVHFGENLAMPASPDPVFWTIQCPLSRSGKLRALVARVPPVMMDVNGRDGRTQSFRVLLPVLGTASLGTYLPSSLDEFAEVFSEREDRDFSVANLEFRSLGKSAYRQDCEVEFLRALP